MQLRNFSLSILFTLTLCLFPQADEEGNSNAYNYSADGITCTYSAEVEFPLNLHFELSAESDADINDIRLHYTVEQDSFAEVVSEVFIEFLPGTAVDVQWTWDMRRTGGLPPGTVVEYWWTVEDTDGDDITTAPAMLQYNDDRYLWQSITEDKVTVYWYQGARSFAEEIMSAAQLALSRLAEDTGAYPRKEVSLYIYASSQELLGAMIFPQEWTGGAAYTRHGVIVIGINPGNLAWGKGAIAHELAHLIVHQMVFNPYNQIPTWLSEGLAMYNEGEMGATFIAYLEKGIRDDNLISVRSLASPFSAYADRSYLSYAQSYSLVEFLIDGYGQAKMLELLNTFSRGSSYDGALETVYGFDMEGLDSLWRTEIKQKYPVGTATTSLP
ncbi:MAG: peptidase MA domain-containing protein [Dehalococcoidales bacterium]|nr:MAG: peptidase MA domain-containing protein [Dehalococcoidales bacterium]